MKTRKIWANLGVEDLERTTEFYTQIGFQPNGFSKELTSFLVGDDNFIIHFFLKEILKSNTKIELTDPKQGNEIIFTLSAESKEEVNQWQEAVKNAGGTIISEAEEFGKGYYGFVFSDPDGHKFNVFYM
ncbi:MAG: VOC family protein [Flavobacterium lindanitolerans]|jgi:predicted lactoylglutathione lyase|uniref:VOC family protein n=1 Tax=Flavobacterium lindanitolerans TaxID=428988 RepID=UPI000DB19D0B|nr:VOC family protein [Flavobacterium lindanitolerans]MBL7868796.1 VOC family protein [Flavobacterium lindanitolerans]MBU7569914.1 VOC family protein [Flavobacterium sp.]PZO29977.1 MAG: glyoxalase [Flavobacteriaceae bacterium]PZQ84690.1 MAG: glyoxalase [Flavobacterium johnsoniae]